jgi:hypothetical protein
MQTEAAATKILSWGQRYDFGELYDIPALIGHEFALVDYGLRGGRLNYFPPIEKCVECERADGQNLPASVTSTHAK